MFLPCSIKNAVAHMCVCTSLSEGLDPATATRFSAKCRFFFGGGGFIVVFAYSRGLRFAPSPGHAFITLHYAFIQGDKQHERKRKTGRGGEGQYNGKLPP